MQTSSVASHAHGAVHLSGGAVPDHFESVEALDDFLAQPSQALVDDLAQVNGDLMILGVAGKMGPTLARLAKNAAPAKRVIGVARFSDPTVRERLSGWGIETLTCDLLDRAAVEALPRVDNIIFAAGHKFGASSNQPLTWAMNTYVPALVADTFRAARIVSFSTGNVYALTPLGMPAPNEGMVPAPVGEYAQSCLGRERMFEYFGAKHGTPGRLFRLNYAIDLRYGVLADIAGKVHRGEEIDVTMGYVNVIWQGDANAQVLRALRHCTVPPSPLNCTGPETISVRWLATQFAVRMGVAARITGAEATTALLSDTTQAAKLFGYPRVPLGTMIDWVADWVWSGRPSFNKPTKFEVRDGEF
ncbi:MAG: epimerase [Rhodoferax sp.]